MEKTSAKNSKGSTPIHTEEYFNSSLHPPRLDIYSRDFLDNSVAVPLSFPGGTGRKIYLSIHLVFWYLQLLMILMEGGKSKREEGESAMECLE